MLWHYARILQPLLVKFGGSHQAFTKFNQHKFIKKSDKSRCRTGVAQSSVEYDAENEETLNNCGIVMKSPVTWSTYVANQTSFEERCC